MSSRDTIAAFDVIDGKLAVGGIPVDRLTERIGSTPFFAYDRRLLTERIALLRRILPSSVNLSYAIKANPMPAIVQHLSSLIDSFDVASSGELRTALDTPMRPDRISFAGPAKTIAELAQAIAAGVTIELESATEARRVIDISQRFGIRPKVAIRVNPDFVIKGSGMRMGGGAQQFGVDSEAVPKLLSELNGADIDILGFHVFGGSQNLHAEILCETQRKTVELVVRLAATMPTPVRYLNLGGGFGIPYFDKDESLDLAMIGANLTELVDGPIRQQLPHVRLVIELGRYIVGECGIYVTRVVDRKMSRGKHFIMVDGGLHHQLAASGNFGQIIRRNYPLVVGNRMKMEATETVNIVGCLCTPLDLLGENVSVPKIELGDLIVLFQAGAYGLTASPNAFLGHLPAAEALV
ncbi:pyridoxal-dependent decarboxylase, exosortase A system-associated [Nitrobacter sp.]|uniref:pyridoxal-dependent decarboxylase, exosortase A system-associated n=1 Tax=Nitrobacter sp. TaxID=29420 RepID=UPI0029CAC2D1|nr:pyridoxal-dependent decarboxylase, exosortase A system-associated [Nitrobacter sp.]